MSRANSEFHWVRQLLPDLDLTDYDLKRIGRKLIKQRFDKFYNTSIIATITFYKPLA